MAGWDLSGHNAIAHFLWQPFSPGDCVMEIGCNSGRSPGEVDNAILDSGWSKSAQCGASKY